MAVVGPGEGATADVIDDARAVGRLVASRGWITLTGGRALGVMAAAIDGAASAAGLTVALLPGVDRADAAPGATVAIATGLGEARDAVLVTAADAVIGCGVSPGTVAELALAIRGHRPTVLVRPTPATAALLRELSAGAVGVVATAADAVAWLAQAVGAAR